MDRKRFYKIIISRKFLYNKWLKIDGGRINKIILIFFSQDLLINIHSKFLQIFHG